MEPENDGERRALWRFMALLLGGEAQHELDLRVHAPVVGPRRDIPQRKLAEKAHHAHNCPAETGDVAICTCGALFRMVLESADDVAAAVIALAKIV